MRRESWQLGVGFGSVWLSKSDSHLLLRIDPSTNTVVARIPVGPDPELGIGIDLGCVWIADTKERSLRQIDPATNAVVRSIAVNISAEPEGSIGVGAGSVWLLTDDNGTDSGTLSRVDPALCLLLSTLVRHPEDNSLLLSSSLSSGKVGVSPHRNSGALLPYTSAAATVQSGTSAAF